MPCTHTQQHTGPFSNNTCTLSHLPHSTSQYYLPIFTWLSLLPLFCSLSSHHLSLSSPPSLSIYLFLNLPSRFILIHLRLHFNLIPSLPLFFSFSLPHSLTPFPLPLLIPLSNLSSSPAVLPIAVLQGFDGSTWEALDVWTQSQAIKQPSCCMQAPAPPQITDHLEMQTKSTLQITENILLAQQAVLLKTLLSTECFLYIKFWHSQ